MPGTFSSLVVASTNDFPGTQNESIKRWVEANGGVFIKQISEDVTHLICSKKAWKQYHPTVKAARHARSIAIVSFDWLEDSLCSKTRKPKDMAKYAFEPNRIRHVIAAQKKKRADKNKNKVKRGMKVAPDEEEVNGGQDEGQDYSVHSASSTASGNSSVKNEKHKANTNMSLAMLTKSEKIEISGKDFDAECAIFEKDMAKSGYKPYIDGNGFIYLITLVRKDVLRNRLEKHRLKLFEYTPESIDHAGDSSRAKQYACYTVFSTAGKRERAMHTLAPPGSNFDFAWAMFRGFFKRKVGATWEDRDTVTVKYEGDRDIDGGCVMGEDGTEDDKFRTLGLLRWKLPSDMAARQPKDVSTEEPCAVAVVNKPAFEEHYICEKASTPNGGW
ncbi:hypothetical protein, variant [Exophiala mesophila]|uniref:Uncharacterized protein n=1 Tax=Exophiala mesophila TaxID=212818 RepID=A0A0D1YZL2_EXOME|nr:hypothetical protein, variant [Exophiala mesophila]KIV88017.1 hypothetical protein, variant [Exophiala mesophila]